jgi:pimeloyl-ACP methyl ester carboxylesterase
MIAPRFLLPTFLLAFAPLAWPQDVRDIDVEHRNGQTFVTWPKLSGSGVRYRVYRSTSKISSTEDLDDADFLGEVDDRSSRNQGRSLASGQEHGWVIEKGEGELDLDDGLFVHTVERSERAYYAVTSVKDGREDRRVSTSRNATSSSLSETPAPPQPVLQDSDSIGELWGHWTSNRTTPYMRALTLWPSAGFNFRFEPGSASGPHGLVVRLHAAGQTYGQGWPQRFEVQRDVDILAVSDLQPYTSWSFWFGAQERLPGLATSGTRVWNYTQERVFWTMDWIRARLGSRHDPERVYAIGGSMGALGAMWLAEEAPERFAAILCRNGLYDLEATDYRNPGMLEQIFGRFDLGLLMRDGLPVLERTNAAFMAGLAPQEDWPVIRTISGRNDETVGWMSAVALFGALERHHRPAVHYFDERTHNPRGYWVDVERALLARTFDTRRDRPSLRFEGCTLDDDAGDGTRTDGDLIGTINGYVDYDPETATATTTALDFDVFLRDSGALDDAPRTNGRAALTPRRTAPFVLAPGERVLYTLFEGSTPVDGHVLLADQHGMVHTPLVPLERDRRHARFQRWTPGPNHLYLGAAPIPGDEMQAVVDGVPGAAWTLFLGSGNAQGPQFTQRNVDYIVLTGIIGPNGLAQVWMTMPPNVQAGTWVWGRVYTAGKLWPAVGVPLQYWP